MAIIPFVFIWKGDRLRANSKFCQYLMEKEVEEERKREQREAKAQASRQQAAGFGDVEKSGEEQV